MKRGVGIECSVDHVDIGLDPRRRERNHRGVFLDEWSEHFHLLFSVHERLLGIPDQSVRLGSELVLRRPGRACAFEEADVVGKKRAARGVETGIGLGKLAVKTIRELQKRAECAGEKFREGFAAGGSALCQMVCQCLTGSC